MDAGPPRPRSRPPSPRGVLGRGGERGAHEAGAGQLFLSRPTTEKASGSKDGRDNPTGTSWENLARTVRKRGYLDAPVPKEKPPPVPVPPAATVVEPSVPVPKENPVDMAAPAQRFQDAERGLGCSSRIKAEAGRGA